MTEISTTPTQDNIDNKKKTFWNRYPRWVYYTVVGLIFAIIIILGVVFGYVLPRNQRIQDCQGVCLAQNVFCSFPCSSQKNECTFKCRFNDAECSEKCANSYSNCTVRCETALNPCLDQCNRL